MVGVIKQRNKATGELENYDIQMANRVIVEKKQKPIEYPVFGLLGRPTQAPMIGGLFGSG